MKENLKKKVLNFNVDLIHAIAFVISPVPYITALKVFYEKF